MKAKLRIFLPLFIFSLMIGVISPYSVIEGRASSSQDLFTFLYLPLITNEVCSPSSNPMKVSPILFVPNNLTSDPSYLPMIDEALSRISLWYGSQLNCRTFNYNAAQMVIGTHELRYYCPNTVDDNQCIQIPGELGADPGDIYRVLDDLHNQGYRIQTGVIQAIFWVGGYGYAAGSKYSDSSGYAAFGDWALDGIAGKYEEGTSTSNCDDSAWAWLICTKDAQTGTVAHELGHSFGLPHPTDDGSLPGDPNYWLSTIMAVSWDFPNVVLIDSTVNPEKTLLFQHPFFQ